MRQLKGDKEQEYMWFADMDRAWLGYKGRVHVEHRKVAKGGGGGGGGQIQGFGLSGGGGGGGAKH